MKRILRLTDRVFDVVEGLEELAKEKGCTLSQLSLAWCGSQPGITSPIIGPRTLQQLDDTFNAFNIELTEEILMKLDEIWPGPGGEAPEAYSW